MFFFDYILLLLALVSAAIFLLLPPGHLYKLYLGIILWFLLYLVIAYQIELIEKVYIHQELTGLQNFLLNYKEIILHFALAFIPILWIVLLVNNLIEIHGETDMFGTLLFGAAFPFLFLGIFSFIAGNPFFDFPFLSRLFSLFGKSSFLDFFREHPHWLFLGLLGLLFYKFIWNILVSLALVIWEWFMRLLFGEREEEEEWEWHEETHEEESHPKRKRHFWE